MFKICLLFFCRLWATDHHQPLRIFAGHLSDVTCTRFHPNSNYVATGSADRTVRLWDVLNGNCVRILTGHKVGGTLIFYWSSNYSVTNKKPPGYSRTFLNFTLLSILGTNTLTGILTHR